MEIDTTKIIGYILLTPGLISVVMYLAQFIRQDALSKVFFGNWTGFEAGFTSALPLYFGLMAIAGAYLIKDNKK